MKRPTFVLGVGLSHDGSACLLRDGEIAFAIEKERLTRKKHDGGNDAAAVQAVLTAAGISLDDVELVVQNENWGMFHGGNSAFGDEPRLIADHPNVVTISHHLAHAYSAIGCSPFDQCSVLVVDGCGNSYADVVDRGSELAPVPSELEHLYFEKDSYYEAAAESLTVVAKDYSPWGERGWPLTPPSTLHSIGGVYCAFSTYIFGGFDDSGKLMGLSPYGNRGVFTDPIFELKDGRVFVIPETLHQFTTPAPDDQARRERFQYHADLSRWVQDEVERALLYLVGDRFERSSSQNLAYAGGVALNAVANRRLLTETPFERLFIQPAAGDNGLAIGCAYYGWLEVLHRPRVRHSGSTYLGRTYPRRDVHTAIASRSGEVTIEPCSDVVEESARLLAEGKVLGWFQGGAEFGPRALGHRSILAHPGLPGLRDHINSNVKRREDFRPFAPSVCADVASDFFACGEYASPHMILVFDVHEEWRDRLTNVVHLDGTSRLHTVTESSEPTYYRLLREFGARTGIPVLLNTSLNRRGMPIVETPDEALEFFLTSALDYLVLDDVILRKQMAPVPASAAPDLVSAT